MARIQVRAEEGLLGAGYPQTWSARVTVTASARRECIVTHVPGDPARAFSEADLKTKFIRFTTNVLGRDRAETEFAKALTVLDRPAEIIREIGQVGRA